MNAAKSGHAQAALAVPAGAGSERVIETTAAPRSESRATLALSASALVVLFSTAAIAYLLPLTPHRMEKASASLLDRLPHWNALATNRPAALDDPAVAAAILIGASLLAFAACALGIWTTWRLAHRRHLWIIVISTGVLSALLNVGSPPNVTSNIYNYILRGRLVSVYGANPYEVAAKEFPQDPVYPYAAERNTLQPGGKLPAWMLWNVAMTWLAGDGVVRSLLTMRIGLFLFGLANLGLVAYLARRLIPEKALAAVVLWAWNPIVILNAQARTDSVMVFYLLAAMYFLVQERHWQGAAALTLSAYVKLLTLPLLAITVLADLRERRWGRIGRATVAVVVTTVLVWAPFATIAGHGSVLSYVEHVTGKAGGGEASTDSLGLLLRGAFAGLILWVGWTRNGSTSHLFQGWAIVQIVFSIFFAKFASADYHMTLIAIIAVTMSPRLIVIALAISLSALLFDEWYRVGSESFQLPDLFPHSPQVMVFVPLLLGFVFLAGLALRSHRKGA